MTHWIIVPVVLPAVLGALIVLAMRNDLLLQPLLLVTDGGGIDRVGR